MGNKSNQKSYIKLTNPDESMASMHLDNGYIIHSITARFKKLIYYLVLDTNRAAEYNYSSNNNILEKL